MIHKMTLWLLQRQAFWLYNEVSTGVAMPSAAWNWAASPFLGPFSRICVCDDAYAVVAEHTNAHSRAMPHRLLLVDAEAELRRPVSQLCVIESMIMLLFEASFWSFWAVRCGRSGWR